MTAMTISRLSLLLTAGLLYGQPAWEQNASDHIAAALKDSGAASVSVAIVQDGKLAYAKAFGQADLAGNRMADSNTRYAVGSISKQFTAAALLLLQEEGKLSLDDKVAKYFPDLTHADEITIRQLLTHTSGYEDYAPQDYLIPAWTKPTNSTALLGEWAKKPLNFDPGTRWQYSNTGYVVAAAIAEKVSGKTLVTFLREHIFSPLKMASAGDCDERSPADATPYTRYAFGPARVVGREASGWYNGAGELCMNAPDLAKWDAAFLQHKILSPRSYEQFTREMDLKNGDHTHYALGLTIADLRGIPMFEHGGEVSGFLAINEVFPTRNGAVIALSNADGVSLTSPLADDLAKLVFLPEQRTEAKSDTESVRSVLAGLQKGTIDPDRFTDNARSYFQKALPDFASSLSALGALKSLTFVNENLRGGMIHRSYRAQFEKKTARLNIYVMPDGRYEQLMVTE
jgi:D-alanyl-D-alanine carboxypeptidase